MFEGMRNIIDPHSKQKGLTILKEVEQKLLIVFEGDDKNPYFEAIYMAYYQYYKMM
jgi:hypothetical protein